MKIRVAFTLDVSDRTLDALREASCCEDLAGMRGFVVAEAAEYVAEYLDGHGVDVAIRYDKVKR